MKEPKIRATATARVEVPPEIFKHLNDVIDCVLWSPQLQAWECAKDDFIVELEQFDLSNARRKQREVYKWLKTAEGTLPSLTTNVVFYNEKRIFSS
jgi:hypothetical protein